MDGDPFAFLDVDDLLSAEIFPGPDDVNTLHRDLVPLLDAYADIAFVDDGLEIDIDPDSPSVLTTLLMSMMMMHRVYGGAGAPGTSEYARSQSVHAHGVLGSALQALADTAIKYDVQVCGGGTPQTVLQTRRYRRFERALAAYDAVFQLPQSSDAAIDNGAREDARTCTLTDIFHAVVRIIEAHAQRASMLEALDTALKDSRLSCSPGIAVHLISVLGGFEDVRIGMPAADDIADSLYTHIHRKHASDDRFMAFFYTLDGDASESADADYVRDVVDREVAEKMHEYAYLGPVSAEAVRAVLLRRFGLKHA